MEDWAIFDTHSALRYAGDGERRQDEGEYRLAVQWKAYLKGISVVVKI
jgi:hypothetical protein